MHANNGLKAFGIVDDWKEAAKKAVRSCETGKDGADIFKTWKRVKDMSLAGATSSHVKEAGSTIGQVRGIFKCDFWADSVTGDDIQGGFQFSSARLGCTSRYFRHANYKAGTRGPRPKPKREGS